MKALLRRHSFAIATAVPTLGVIVVTAFLLLRVLALPLTGKTAVPVLVASITLPGVIATAVVSLIGYFLKQSVDLRTTRLGEQAAEVANVEQQRLRMESAMETVKLLATQDGKAAPVVQVSAALIVLSKLGEIDLALDLAAEMWPKKQITSSSAVALCDVAIASGDIMLQRAAAILILNNWRLLISEHGQAQWPSCLLNGWPSNLDAEARGIITEALVAWVTESPGKDFRSRLIEASSEHNQRQPPGIL
jgi:hypothetical protein